MNHKPKINSQKKTWFNLYFIKNAALCIIQNKSTISLPHKTLHHVQLIPDETQICTSSSAVYTLCKKPYRGLFFMTFILQTIFYETIISFRCSPYFKYWMYANQCYKNKPE